MEFNLKIIDVGFRGKGLGVRVYSYRYILGIRVQCLGFRV